MERCQKIFGFCTTSYAIGLNSSCHFFIQSEINHLNQSLLTRDQNQSRITRTTERKPAMQFSKNGETSYLKKSFRYQMLYANGTRLSENQVAVTGSEGETQFYFLQ